MSWRSGLFLILFLAIPGWANGERAWVNYALSCQGCHLPDAMGMQGKVPRLNGFVGYFLHSDAGRRFVIQVPGVSNSNLSDEELSELMNWILIEFSAAQIPTNFVPYTAEEVNKLRKDPEPDPLDRRGDILTELAATVPELNCYTDAWVTVGDCQ